MLWKKYPQNVDVYRNFTELCKRVQTLRFSVDWKLEIGTEVELKKLPDHNIVPEFVIIISESSQFTIAVYGWLLPSDLYKTNSRSMCDISVSSLLNEIASYVMCPGLPEASNGGEVKRHTIPEGAICQPYKRIM